MRLTGVAILLIVPGVGRAQEEVRNYRKPILVAETGGHHSRVHSMFWQDEDTLLSAGEDKVVNVWDFRDGARLVRSLRPPIWRGLAGTIFAMAASRPDTTNKSYLAVGGYGVENRRGDITVFRFPWLEAGAGQTGRILSGDVVKRLLPPPDDPPGQPGHINVVQCLAFDPTGKLLASGSLDRMVILWDVPAFTARTVLRGHTAGIRALAFSPDGLRLATTGADGSIRIWDTRTGVSLEVQPGNLNPVAINTLAFGPSLVVGRENGDLFRFDSRSLLQFPSVRLQTQPEQGPIEFLVFSPDATRLAVCTKSGRADTIDPTAIASDLEIRAMPEGGLIRRYRVPGQVFTCAFSPSGKRLAYSGGHSQSIFVQDATRLDDPPLELKGQGSTPFDLGFTADSQRVALWRGATDVARPQAYETFDLAARKTGKTSRDQLRRAIPTLNGWSVKGSITNYVLEAVNDDGRRWRADLNRGTERNWWSSTMIPPGPGHPRPTVAIGCESGVVVYDLDTGSRTRVFAGHSGPVVSVVPSPDGRWLASSSVDQTVLIYSLAGCDTRPGLGATFRQRPDGAWMISEVEPRGFAAGMGLVAGDVIASAGIASGGSRTDYATPEKINEFLDRARESPPYLQVLAFNLRRTLFLPAPFGMVALSLPTTGTTKRNSPVMSLFLGVDQEWVLWTPQGFYDTSIEGDRRFLGWHINADYRSVLSTEFVPMSTYSRIMFQPKVLQQLWQTGDLERAMVASGLPAGIPTFDRLAYEQQPPRITFGPVRNGVLLPAPGILWKVDVADPKIELNISAPGWSKISRRRVVADDQVLNLPALAAPTTQVVEEVPLRLTPRRSVRLAVEAISENQTRRTETIDLIYLPPAGIPVPPPPSKGRLIILSIGNDQATKPQLLPAVLFANRDSENLAAGLADHLVSRDGTDCRHDPEADRVILTGANASATSITQAFDHLFRRLQAKQIQKGDVVAVVIASHVLEFDKETVITTSDSDPEKRPVVPSISARDLSELLGRITDYGCRVLLFVDGVHQLPDTGLKAGIKPWVRDLQQNRRVITFVASKEGPSDVSQRVQQGVFAQGVQDALIRAGSRAYTLEAFRRQLRQEVLTLSERVQESDAYLPIEVDPRSVFGRP